MDYHYNPYCYLAGFLGVVLHIQDKTYTMTQEDWEEWCDAQALRPLPRLMVGKEDPIVILVYPALNRHPAYNLLGEGVVVRSDTPLHPVGYYSFVWRLENFEFTEGGKLIYDDGTGKQTEALPAWR